MVLFFSCEKNCTYVLTRKTKIVFMFCFISFALGHKLSIIGFLSVLKVSRQRNDMKGESTKLPCLKSWQFYCKISFIRIQNFVSRFKWNNSTFLDLWIIIAIGCDVMVDSVTYYYKHFSDSFLQEEVKAVFSRFSLKLDIFWSNVVTPSPSHSITLILNQNKTYYTHDL